MSGSDSKRGEQPGTEERERADGHGAPPAALVADRIGITLPAVAAGFAFEAHDQRQQRLRRGPVGVVDEERPAEPRGECCDLLAMRVELGLIGGAQGLGAVRRPALIALDAEKFRAAFVGQRFFGRVEHLNEMSTDALRGQRLGVLADLVRPDRGSRRRG